VPPRTLLQLRDKKDRLRTILAVVSRTQTSLLVSNVFTTQLPRAAVPLTSLCSKESRTKRSLSVSELETTLPKMDKSTNKLMRLSLLRRETQNSYKRLWFTTTMIGNQILTSTLNFMIQTVQERPDSLEMTPRLRLPFWMKISQEPLDSLKLTWSFLSSNKRYMLALREVRDLMVKSTALLEPSQCPMIKRV